MEKICISENLYFHCQLLFYQIFLRLQLLVCNGCPKKLGNTQRVQTAVSCIYWPNLRDFGLSVPTYLCDVWEVWVDVDCQDRHAALPGLILPGHTRVVGHHRSQRVAHLERAA